MNRSAAYVYVLTALRGGPMHGLGIAEAVSDLTDGMAVLGPGTLYRCLKDLHDDGLIRRVAAPQGQEGASRKFYALTDLGRAELAQAVREFELLIRAARPRPGTGDPAGAVS